MYNNTKLNQLKYIMWVLFHLKLIIDIFSYWTSKWPLHKPVIVLNFWVKVRLVTQHIMWLKIWTHFIYDYAYFTWKISSWFSGNCEVKILYFFKIYVLVIILIPNEEFILKNLKNIEHFQIYSKIWCYFYYVIFSY